MIHLALWVASFLFLATVAICAIAVIPKWVWKTLFWIAVGVSILIINGLKQ